MECGLGLWEIYGFCFLLELWLGVLSHTAAFRDNISRKHYPTTNPIKLEEIYSFLIKLYRCFTDPISRPWYSFIHSNGMVPQMQLYNVLAAFYCTIMWISVFTYWERCPVTSKMYMLIFCIHQNRNSIGFLFDKCDRNVFNLMTLNFIALVIARDHGNTFNEDREFIFLNSLFIIYFSKFLIHLNFI